MGFQHKTITNYLLCVLSVLRGFILINRRDRKGFGEGLQHKTITNYPLCVLSALRGLIFNNRRARGARKGFGYGLSAQNYSPSPLRTLRSLRFIFYVALGSQRPQRIFGVILIREINLLV